MIGASEGGGLRRAALLVCLAASAAVLGAGCSRAPVTVSFESAPRTLDPHHHNEVVVWSLLCNFYDSLVRFSPELVVEPDLAVSWERPDPTRLRFHLRRDVHFHDGRSFTADDVVASFHRAFDDPLSRVRHHLVGIQNVTAEDDYTVLFETDTPAPTLLNRLGFLFIVPRGDAGLSEIEAPVGTGPYRFVRRRSDGAVVARAVSGWRGTPEIEDVVFTFTEDDRERSRRLMAKLIDVAVRLSYADVDAVASQPGMRVEPQPKLTVQILEVSPRQARGAAREALADARVRRALLMAIDRRDLVDRVYRGNATVATQYVHPMVFGFDPAIEAVPFDRAEARRMLAEAGFPDGFEVTLGHGRTHSGAPGFIARNLAEIGVRVNLLPLSFAELIDRTSRRAGLRFYGRLCTTGDASEYLDSAFHTPDPLTGLGAENYSGYADPATDALLEAANREMDPARRMRMLQQAQHRILDQVPVLPLVVPWEFLGVRDDLRVTARHDGWLWVAGFHWRSGQPG